MPYYCMEKVWTPLELIGLRLYRDQQTKTWFIKWRNRRRRKLKI